MVLRFVCLLISTTLIISNIIIILIKRLYKIFAIRLFLYLSIAQLFIFIPILLFPFISNGYGNPRNSDIINQLECQIQGLMVMLGWQMATYISIFMSYSVIQALQGRNPIKGKHYEYKVLAVFFTISLVLILFTFFFGNKYEGTKNHSISILVMGSHVGGVQYYYFCNSKNIDVEIFTASLDLFMLLFSVGFSVKIRLLQIELHNLGFHSENLLVNVNKFSLSQLFLSTINLLFKFLDN